MSGVIETLRNGGLYIPATKLLTLRLVDLPVRVPDLPRASWWEARVPEPEGPAGLIPQRGLCATRVAFLSLMPPEPASGYQHPCSPRTGAAWFRVSRLKFFPHLQPKQGPTSEIYHLLSNDGCQIMLLRSQASIPDFTLVGPLFSPWRPQ